MKEDIRSKILSASAQLLEESGLGALSMREVARRAGVSHQAPYHYFADREAILAELVKQGFEKLHAYELDALDGPVDAKARVKAVGTAYVMFALDYPAIFQLMFRPELVDMERYPEAKCVADDAFNVPLAEIAAFHGKDPEQSTTEMLACWSLSHGLATLLLEGKLESHIGSDEASKKAAVDAVLSFHVSKYEPKND